MHDIYKRLEKDGKIGKFDAQGNARPFEEYPKWVNGPELGPDGLPIRVIVNSQREELSMAARAAQTIPDEISDPVVAENQALRAQLAQMQAQLDRAAGAKPEAEPPPQDDSASGLAGRFAPAKSLTI